MTYRRTHKLKCWESVFLAVRAREKRAEFRRNDRDFAVGDLVILQRFRPDECDGRGAYIRPDGSRVWEVTDAADVERVVISHIATGFGIPDGYCMFSFWYEDEEKARL